VHLIQGHYGILWKLYGNCTEIPVVHNILLLQLLCCTKKREHITPVLVKVHWLPVIYQIHYTVLLYVYKAVHDLAIEYIISTLIN